MEPDQTVLVVASFRRGTIPTDWKDKSTGTTPSWIPAIRTINMTISPIPGAKTLTGNSERSEVQQLSVIKLIQTEAKVAPLVFDEEAWAACLRTWRRLYKMWFRTQDSDFERQTNNKTTRDRRPPTRLLCGFCHFCHKQCCHTKQTVRDTITHQDIIWPKIA